MSTLARKRFFEQLAILIRKQVTVVTLDGKTYYGSLEGYNPETLSICLSNVKEEGGNLTHMIFINGNIVSKIFTAEKPFDLKALADRLEKVFPRMIRLYEEIGVIIVMDRIRVNETGIIEGTGPTAERVQKVYDEFMREIRT